jgi:hypothetical protein
MTVPTPDRTITGLQPRKRPAAGAAALVRENRPPAEAPPETVAAASPEQQPPKKKTTKARTPKRAPGRGKAQIAVDVREDIRAQARAAFRAAAYFERVPTFSQFVENAIAAEIERIEKAYNNGDPLEPISENLPSGRPTGS